MISLRNIHKKTKQKKNKHGQTNKKKTILTFIEWIITRRGQYVTQKKKSYNAKTRSKYNLRESNRKVKKYEREREIHQKYRFKWFFGTSNGRFKGSRDREEEGSRARAGFVFLLSENLLLYFVIYSFLLKSTRSS